MAVPLSCPPSVRVDAQDWWSGAFRAAIRSFRHVVAVLDPWDGPVALTRAWCLWRVTGAQ